VDEVLPEPPDGIETDPAAAAVALRRAVRRHLRELRTATPTERLRRRGARYGALGLFEDRTDSDGDA
jgi:acetyl-CoA carboxylase carboxyl transferase subunit alpha